MATSPTHSRAVKRKDPSPTGGRVSLRTIARAAKVSVMAVSYALRNSPEVSEGERRRIRKIAEELGYRPDPLLTHLMQHLRSHRTLKSAANLAVLTMLEAGFVDRLLSGAVERAERLGYHLDRIDARSYVERGRSLTRTLLARGISGVLLAPAVDPASYSALLDWGKFAAVAMTYSLVEPRAHRVVTHHFDNAVRTFALLEQRGYRRLGLAMTRDMELRANHSYSSAYYRAASVLGVEPLPVLIFDTSSRRDIRAWFTKHRPDAVVMANANQAREFFRPALSVAQCNRTALVCLDFAEEEKVSGMDQLFEKIGSHAVDALVAQIHRNERGLPENPTVTMVEGRWVDSFGYYPLKA